MNMTDSASSGDGWMMNMTDSGADRKVMAIDLTT